MTSTQRTRRFQILTALGATVISVLIAGLIWRGREPTRVITPFEPHDPAAVWRDPLYVVDSEVGHRGRANVIYEFEIGPFDGSETERIVRRSGARGFIREEPLPDELPDELPARPVLMLGDSHLAGVVNTAENASARLEKRLRADPRFADVAVLNAGAGYYSLYQYVLRARQLVPELEPRAVVVVVFMGNDIYDLEDVGRPHLDDALRERHPERDGPTSPPVLRAGWRERKDELGLPERFEQLDHQGFCQLTHFQANPERIEPLARKAERSVELMKRVTDDHAARLIWVLLPSFDLVFPGLASGAGDYAREAVESGAHERFYNRFRAILEQSKSEVVDLLPAFRERPALNLYATDFHIWKLGHEILAEVVAGVLLGDPTKR